MSIWRRIGMIEGISHITFIVKELERSARLLEKVFDAKEVYSSGEKTFSLSKEEFFLIGNAWIALMEGASLRERTYNHVAFQVSKEEISLYRQRIQELGLDILPGRKRIEGESESLYFYDYDNHLFEIHSGTLDERLARYQQV